MLLNNEYFPMSAWIIVFEYCPKMWNDVEKTMQMQCNRTCGDYRTTLLLTKAEKNISHKCCNAKSEMTCKML